jgi:hypothetical protein
MRRVAARIQGRDDSLRRILLQLSDGRPSPAIDDRALGPVARAATLLIRRRGDAEPEARGWVGRSLATLRVDARNRAGGEQQGERPRDSASIHAVSILGTGEPAALRPEHYRSLVPAATHDPPCREAGVRSFLSFPELSGPG